MMCTSTFAHFNDENDSKGDVNGDGKVDVADITAVIEIMKNGKGTIILSEYFYLGTIKPTPENYKILPGVENSYMSLEDAFGTTTSVYAGQTVYMLCPSEWIKGKRFSIEIKSGESVHFLDEIDASTILGYVILQTQVWDISSKATLKSEDVVLDEDTIKYDENSPEVYVGYYRVDITPPVKTSQPGFHRIAIPIQSGDVITTNSTIPGTSTAGHVLIDSNENMTPIVPVSGCFSITSEMINNGATTLGISWQDSVTPHINVSVVRKNNIVNEIKSDSNIEIIKVDSTTFKVYIPSGNNQRVCYIFEKQYKKWDSLNYKNGDGTASAATDVVSCDYWNNSYICINDGVNNNSAGYIIQGNTNMIYKIIGAPNHVGNGHGCEKSIYRKFLTDGKELDIEGMNNNTAITCKAFRYIQKSECYATDGSGNHYTSTYPQLDINGNPIVDNIHYMECLFELNNKVSIKNRMQVMRNGIRFYALYDAMLECNYDKFKYVYVNNADNTINQVLGYAVEQTTPIASNVNLRLNNDQLANIVEMYGVNHYVSQIVIDDDPSRHNKHTIHCEFYENTGRLKTYFQSIGASSISSTGIQTETFNAGDVISITSIREIELQ